MHSKTCTLKFRNYDASSLLFQALAILINVQNKNSCGLNRLTEQRIWWRRTGIGGDSNNGDNGDNYGNDVVMVMIIIIIKPMIIVILIVTIMMLALLLIMVIIKTINIIRTMTRTVTK